MHILLLHRITTAVHITPAATCPRFAPVGARVWVLCIVFLCLLLCKFPRQTEREPVSAVHLYIFCPVSVWPL